MWERRYREINDWEHYLADNGFVIVKLFLNLSKEEQRIRFLKRLDLADKNWKFSASDIRERAFWDDYQKAFSEMLSKTSTEWAPWYVIPADHKWFARICASAILGDALMRIDPQYPTVSAERRRDLLVVKGELEAEAPKGAPATRTQPRKPRHEPGKLKGRPYSSLARTGTRRERRYSPRPAAARCRGWRTRGPPPAGHR